MQCHSTDEKNASFLSVLDQLLRNRMELIVLFLFHHQNELVVFLRDSGIIIQTLRTKTAQKPTPITWIIHHQWHNWHYLNDSHHEYSDQVDDSLRHHHHHHRCGNFVHRSVVRRLHCCSGCVDCCGCVWRWDW